MDTDSLIVTPTGYQNLKRAGRVDADRLGALAVEKTAETAYFRGAKDYEFGDVPALKRSISVAESDDDAELVIKLRRELADRQRIKGISKRATQLSENVYSQDQFYSFDYLAARGFSGMVRVEPRVKTLSRRYEKGTITRSGRVDPLRVFEW